MLEQEKSLNFIGNVEGRDMNEYAADVYVCDGFTGNILLKYGESLYDLFIDKLPNDPEIQAFSFEHYGGSALLGVKGNIIIGHGISGKLSFTNMLLRAQEIISSNLVQKITEAFQPLKNA